METGVLQLVLLSQDGTVAMEILTLRIFAGLCKDL